MIRCSWSLVPQVHFDLCYLLPVFSVSARLDAVAELVRFDLLVLWHFVRGEFLIEYESLVLADKKQEDLALCALGRPSFEVEHFVDEADRTGFEMY